MAGLPSPLYGRHFLATKTEKQIAERLREDEALLNDGKMCSWLAWDLPSYDSDQGRKIASQLAPNAGLGHEVKKLIYENIRNKIRRHHESAGTVPKAYAEADRSHAYLAASEISTALKVMIQLQNHYIIQNDTSAETIMGWLTQALAPEDMPSIHDYFATGRENIPKPPTIPRKRLCYICNLSLTNPHPSYPSMCIPCGAFNLASSLLSTPSKLSLPSTFTALVTGARINLGYHTALRLLRCGARVIATTRYPRDAVARYLGEHDSAEWGARLKVVGADFRCASDAFTLVEGTKRCLSAWAEGEGGEPKLHVLINNAAQTLTDGLRKENQAVRRETILAKDMGNKMAFIEGTYKARVRGEALPLALEGADEDATGGENAASEPNDSLQAINTESTSELEPYTQSSWVQSLSEIPYEDVISAHAVNTFVPLILCRELLPLMGDPSPSDERYLPNRPPQGYIINVSSREGIFEDTIRSSKRGKHVHTNMSKAALNMITETEAATAWQQRRVAMNTVDPGYMSAAPEYEDAFDGVRPIGWEDGAGRVLWPIAVAEIEGMIVRGRFLKHYGAVDVDPGTGRG